MQEVLHEFPLVMIVCIGEHCLTSCAPFMMLSTFLDRLNAPYVISMELFFEGMYQVSINAFSILPNLLVVFQFHIQVVGEAKF